MLNNIDQLIARYRRRPLREITTSPIRSFFSLARYCILLIFSLSLSLFHFTLCLSLSDSFSVPVLFLSLPASKAYTPKYMTLYSKTE